MLCCSLLLFTCTNSCLYFVFIYRQLTVYKLISNLWNSEDFNPIAPAAQCHSDFVLATDCSYEQVRGLHQATPQKIADCLALMQSDLLEIIPKWEQSGQGEGGCNNELDKTFDNHNEHEDADSSINSNSRRQSSSSASSPCASIGALSNRPGCALQSRRSFVGGRPSYVLYYLEVADAHINSCNLRCRVRLSTSNAGAADATVAPSTVSSTGRRSS